MNRSIIAVLIGAIIVFVYSAMSWMVLPTHQNALKYTPAETAIMEAITSGISDEGVYAIPGSPPGLTEQQKEEQWKANEGKPWVMLTYHPGWSMAMGGPMALAFVYDLLSVLILVWVMTRASSVFATFGARFTLCLAFGVFTLMNSTLQEVNWWHLPWHYASGEAIDHVVEWTLCGIWLGAYLKPRA